MRKELIQAATSYAEAGYTIIRVKGKIPETQNWTKADYVFPEDVPKLLEKNEKGENKPVDGFGVVLSRFDLVIDIDPRNFKPGDKPHVRLFKDAAIDIKNCGCIVQTGGGGIHIYFRLAEAIKIRETLPDYPGIEFKSRGRQVVGAGSKHPNTGELYRFVDGKSIRDTAQAPRALIQIIQRAELDAKIVTENIPAIKEGTRDSDLEVVSRYVEYLKTAPPAIQGEQGDKTTYTVACKGRDLGLSRQKVLDLMLTHYNHRCMPDWSPEELEFKIRNAYSYATGVPGGDLPESDFVAVDTPDKHPLWRGWDTDHRGIIKKTLNNAFNFFISTETAVYFRDVVAYDEFNGQVRIVKKLPWHTNPLPVGGLEWKDEDSTQLKLWLSREKRFDVRTELIDEAVLIASRQLILHPVKDYLCQLRWDGKPRLETWLIEYAGAKDTPFVREASKKFLLQAVSRVYHPGCKADHIIVLEGPQGVGKSTVVEILGGQWYADINIDPHARDTVDGMRGKWFLEISEMVAANKHDAQAMKAFITRRVDRVRLAYGRRSVDLPRQCVFAGTMNPDATKEYFDDTTGNRRWWPIEIHKVNFNAISVLRDQLFAEAVDLVMKGEASYITDRHVLELATAEQKARQISDPWGAAIAEFVSDKHGDFITTKDVWVYALKGSESVLNVAHQRRIAACLKELGFEATMKRDKTGRAQIVRGFVYAGAGPVDWDRKASEMFN